MLNVHLCSSRGVWLFADKHLWDAGPLDAHPDEMPIDLFVYGKTVDWQTLASDLEKAFSDWPGEVKSQWPGGGANGS
jgi:hypothetical protein